MATALTSLFGSEIKVFAQPRLAEIQFVGYPGAHGVTGMNLGTRGKPLVITGTLRYAGSGYDDSREHLDALIAVIEALLSAEAADYTYHGQTYEQVQFVRFELVPGGQGKVYHMTADCVLVNFIMHGHILE
jgi:hypothetical protein